MKNLSALNAIGNASAKIGGFVSNVIGMHAEGGIFNQPTLGIIGEAGPEAVIPLSRGLSGAGIGGLTLNISGNSFVGREGIAEKIGNDIMKVLKRNIQL
jgi:phage-related minor tail protein